MKAQRLRFRYRLTAAALAFNHRDIVNAWIAALAAAGAEVAMSEGKRPSPQVSLGAPLPQGVTSDCELADVFLAVPVDPRDIRDPTSAHLPDGLDLVSVQETSVGGPSLQSQVKWAEYEVCVSAAGIDQGELAERVRDLLASDSFPFEYRKEERVKQIDLRPLVLSLSVEGDTGDTTTLRMRLRAEPEATARADQVVAALGLEQAARIHRTSLHLAGIPPAIAAYRKVGEPDRL
jgi:radical SAM-linked protein